MLKHVLVPLDGSKLAEEALEHAVNIICPDGKITLLSAVDVPEVPIYGYYPPATVPDYQSTVEDLLPQAKNYLEQIAKGLEGPGIAVEIEVHIGEPSQVIAETAVRLKVDAIVMSTHGRSGLSRWLFGSVTNKVLGTRCCPVFVIPSRQSEAKT
ncbi:MAG: universal stress protein [Chloroflexi bacterium]|nr:universal stress protein [Chloroflexota bacterium]MDL1885638.1 universal stress protein [Anaerolineae bacterium CFX8]